MIEGVNECSLNSCIFLNDSYWEDKRNREWLEIIESDREQLLNSLDQCRTIRNHVLHTIRSADSGILVSSSFVPNHMYVLDIRIVFTLILIVINVIQSKFINHFCFITQFDDFFFKFNVCFIDCNWRSVELIERTKV